MILPLKNTLWDADIEYYYVHFSIPIKYVVPNYGNPTSGSKVPSLTVGSLNTIINIKNSEQIQENTTISKKPR
jgi:hypothetical protein